MADYTPSARMRAAAAAECRRVDREIARVDGRERDLLDRLAVLKQTRADLEREREALTRFAGGEPETPSPGERGLRAVPGGDPVRLRGPRIREQAIRVLAAAEHDGAPIHYRDWYALLRSAGYVSTGQDPLATFLTQVRRSPLVRSTTTKGVYVIDSEVLPRARARMRTLTAQLQSARAPQDADAEAVRTARDERDATLVEIRRLERDIDEIERSIDTAPTHDPSRLADSGLARRHPRGADNSRRIPPPPA